MLILIQIIWILLILGISLFFGLSPQFLKKFVTNHSNKTKILGYSNALSGGIFFSIAFFHLLPEANESFTEYFVSIDKEKLNEYPFCFTCAFFAYALILFIEKIAFNSHSLIDHEHLTHEIKSPLPNQNDENSLNNELKQQTDYKSFNDDIEAFSPQEKNGIRSPLITVKDDKIEVDENKQVSDCIERAYDMNKELQFIQGKKTIHDDSVCSDGEEEIIKGVIGNKGQYMAFMQVRNLKCKFIYKLLLSRNNRKQKIQFSLSYSSETQYNSRCSIT